eukprot:scaffold210454_cov45-Attheya_sp.AAC.2
MMTQLPPALKVANPPGGSSWKENIQVMDRKVSNATGLKETIDLDYDCTLDVCSMSSFDFRVRHFNFAITETPLYLLGQDSAASIIIIIP